MTQRSFPVLIFLLLANWQGAVLLAQVNPQPRAAWQDTSTVDSNRHRVQILNADILSFQRVDGLPLQKLLGNVRLMQDSTFFSCDSAYYYESQNRLEAYDNVTVIMPDSVVMTAERATYDSETRIAEVFDNITLTDRSVTLTTDHLTYDREEEYGYYRDGGKLVDEETELTSVLGYYYPQEDMAYFRKNVVLKHPDYTLKTDTLGYHTDTKIATFLTQTTILSKDGTIETTSGNYDTQGRRVNLFARSQVRDSSYLMSADTLFYDDETNMGFAIGKVIVDQIDSSLQIRGNYGEFDRGSDRSMVAERPVAIQVFEDDTLFLFADTLRSFSIERYDTVFATAATPVENSLAQDSSVSDTVVIPQPDSSWQVLDSVALPAPPLLQPEPRVVQDVDTVKRRLFKGYHDVSFFMRELQGRCDSMVYYYDDSVLFLYQKPVLWSEENQLTGDTIKVWMANGKADSMWIGPNAFLVSKEDTVGYNQMKGKEMRASFRQGNLYCLEIRGNAESIYFAKEEDTVETRYQGLNQALSQAMNLYFTDNELQKIVFLAQPEGTFKPMFEVIFQENQLDGMPWRIDEKPEEPDAIAIMQGPWPPDLPFELPTLPEGAFDPEEETSPKEEVTEGMPIPDAEASPESETTDDELSSSTGQ